MKLVIIYAAAPSLQTHPHQNRSVSALPVILLSFLLFHALINGAESPSRVNSSISVDIIRIRDSRCSELSLLRLLVLI